MSLTSGFFEHVPVETVKKIAQKFSDENATGGDGELTEKREKPPVGGWRELAERVQHERDPKRITELVSELISKLDEEKLGERAPRKLKDGKE